MNVKKYNKYWGPKVWLCLLTVDDQYQALAACTDHMGKIGKPPKPPAVVFNNHLLLQPNALKEEKGRTWAEIQQLFVRLFPDKEFPPAVPLIRSAVQLFSRTKNNQQQKLQYDHDIYYVGPFTKETGVTRSALTKENLPMYVSLTNRLVSASTFCSQPRI